jgi:glycosyltransferase involved in cell wall biosynthesis
MKIAVVGTRGFPNIRGKIESHCENLYPRLAAKGCEVVVFTRQPYVIEPKKEYKGVSLVPIDCPTNPYFEALVHTLKGIFAARKLKPGLMHFHGIGPALCLPLARLLGMKTVMTHHGQDYQGMKWGRIARMFLKAGEFLGCKFANEVIAVSGSISADIRKHFGRTATVIPYGVTVPQVFPGETTLTHFALTERKYILCVGRFVPEKGFHHVIDAFARFQSANASAAYQEWKLVIVGWAEHDTPYSQALTKKARENKNVILAGYLSGARLWELYAHAGLFILPSYYEGLPLALLEAMSYGVSCLASDIPANKELGLSEDRYFKPWDAVTLINKIKEFVDKPMPQEARDTQARQILERYHWDKAADETFHVYERVLKAS